MSTPDTPHADALALQEVLTRYVDSRDGYRQAAELVPQEGLAKSFGRIAERRGRIAGKVAELIEAQGRQPDAGGSTAAGLHRWWLRLRDKVTENEADAILAECVRGESELVRTLKGVLEDPRLQPAHRELVSDMIAEVSLALHAFDSATGDLEPDAPPA